MWWWTQSTKTVNLSWGRDNSGGDAALSSYILVCYNTLQHFYVIHIAFRIKMIENLAKIVLRFNNCAFCCIRTILEEHIRTVLDERIRPY